MLICNWRHTPYTLIAFRAYSPHIRSEEASSSGVTMMIDLDAVALYAAIISSSLTEAKNVKRVISLLAPRNKGTQYETVYTDSL
mgnify:FL=1